MKLANAGSVPAGPWRPAFRNHKISVASCFSRLLALTWTASLLGPSAQAQVPPTFTWAQKAGSTIPDAASAVAVDSAGNVYVIGSFGKNASFGGTVLPGSATYDLFLTKLSAGGQFLWAKSLHTSVSVLTALRL